MAGNRETALKNLAKIKRKRGPNKLTNLKNAFIEAFEEIGGTAELARWAKQQKNRRDFYILLARMLPKSVDVEGKFEHHITDYAAIISRLVPELTEGDEAKKAE